MPELPEAETIRRALADAVLGGAVTRVIVRRRDVITISPGSRRERVPIRLFAGDTIATAARYGKQLALVSRHGRAVQIRLGMTGAVVLRDTLPRGNPHDHVIWELRSDGQTRWMVFRDPRRFGGLTCFPSREALVADWSRLGPDARTIRADQLASVLEGRRSPIKAALLNQHLLAGVGNIYADESLHLAGLHPRIIAADLDANRVARLATSLRAVLNSAIRHRGSTILGYSDPDGSPGNYQDRHRVYGRAGLPCHRCDVPLRKDLLAQRTTVYCPQCQPLDDESSRVPKATGRKKKMKE